MNTLSKLIVYYTIVFFATFFISATNMLFQLLDSRAIIVIFVTPAVLIPIVWIGIKFLRGNAIIRKELESTLKLIPVLGVGYVFLYGAGVSLFHGDIYGFSWYMLFVGLLVLLCFIIKFLRERSTTGTVLQQKLLENQQKGLTDLSELKARLASIEKMLKEIE